MHTSQKTVIDIFDTGAVIYVGKTAYDMEFGRLDVQQWAKKHRPDWVSTEKDPDDGLTSFFIEDDFYKELAEDFTLNHKEQWKPVEE